MRREIRDLMDNYPDQWSLYMLALDSLHRADQSDPFSFYGLACRYDSHDVLSKADLLLQLSTEDRIRHGEMRLVCPRRLARQATVHMTMSYSWGGIGHILPCLR